MKNLCLILTLLLSISKTQAKEWFGVITAKDVNLRLSANTNSRLLGKLEQYSIVKILERQEKPTHIAVQPNPPLGVHNDPCDKFYWYKISYQGNTAWVFGAFLFEFDLYKGYPIAESGDKIHIERGHIVFANRPVQADYADFCYGDYFGFVVPEDFARSSRLKAQPLLFKNSGVCTEANSPYLRGYYSIFTCFLSSPDKIIVAQGEALGSGTGYPFSAGLHVVEFSLDKQRQAWIGTLLLDKVSD